LGSLSPDASESATVIPPPRQGALHYRANGGAAGVGVVTGSQSAHASYVTSGVIYPYSDIRFKDITDGTSNTLLLGETSSAQGRALKSRSWGGIQPWTWGFYSYDAFGPPIGSGCLMIDSKAVQYPIGYAGTFLTNFTPYTSAHAGPGANFVMCDGSVRFMTQSTPLDLLQNLAVRDDGNLAIIN
jgi:prepilin-type processing-associated H-X9-DG protein